MSKRKNNGDPALIFGAPEPKIDHRKTGLLFRKCREAAGLPWDR